MKNQVINQVLKMIPRKDLSANDLALIEMMYEAGCFLSVEILAVQSEVVK